MSSREKSRGVAVVAELMQESIVMGYYAELKAITDQFDHLRGPALMDQIERAIALADSKGDEAKVTELRIDLVQLASHYDCFDRELKAFVDMCSHQAQSPGNQQLTDMVAWYYKWILDRAPDWADVSIDMIEQLFAEMEKFYLAQGLGLKPLAQLRFTTAAAMGKKEEADQYYEASLQMDDDKADDCAACQTDSKVMYLLQTGRIPEAIEAAEPVLSGDQSCDTVPTTTVSRLLIPLAFTGQAERAEMLRHFVYRHVRRVPKLLGHLADHVIFLAVTGRALEAVRPCAILLARAEQTQNTRIRFEAYRAVWCSFALLLATGQETVRLARVPPFDDGTGPVNTLEVMTLAGERAVACAEALDQRNGTDRFELRLRSTHDLVKHLISSNHEGDEDASDDDSEGEYDAHQQDDDSDSQPG